MSPSSRMGRPPIKERVREEDRGHGSPCHIWLLTKTKKGYGSEWDGRTMRSAHILAWERVNGPLPPGQELDHLCSQRDCVNPDHLEAVTHSENVRRGRRTFLRPADVLTIKLARATTTLTGPAIGEMCGVTHGAVYKVLKGRTWA